MKKRILSLFLLLILLLSGCSRDSSSSPGEGKKPQGNRKDDPIVSSDEPKSELPEPEPVSGVYVTLEPEEHSFSDPESGIELLHYLNYTPSVILPDNSNGEKAVNAELMKLSEEFRSGSSYGDGSESGVNALLTAAKTDLKDRGTEGFYPYAMERRIRVTRGDSAILSLRYENYAYTGGAHGYTASFGVTFNPESGKKLSLSDLSSDPDAFLSFCLNEITSQCRAMEAYLFEDYASCLPQLLDGSCWYLTDNGIVFVADPYLIAPYASGALEFSVSYKKLGELLKADYRIPDRAAVQGGLDGCVAADVDLEGREPLLDYKVTEIGETFVFWAKNNVYSVRLRRAVYSEETGYYEEGEELFFLGRMKDGEFFRVKTDVPDVLPNVMLTWRLPDGTTQRYLISQSGMDGSLILIDSNSLAQIAPGEISGSLPWFQYDLNGDGVTDAVDVTDEEEGWLLRVSGREEYSLPLPFTARPRICLADVDGDSCTEMILTGETDIVPQAVYIYRYDRELCSVPFRENDRDFPYMPCRVLGADTEELVLSGTVSVFGRYEGCRAYGDGPEGTVAPAFGSEWDLSGNQERLTTACDLPFEQLNGSAGRLSAGTTLRITGFDGVQKVRFEADGGMSGWFYVTRTTDGKHAINGKSEELCFRELT